MAGYMSQYSSIALNDEPLTCGDATYAKDSIRDKFLTAESQRLVVQDAIGRVADANQQAAQAVRNAVEGIQALIALPASAHADAEGMEHAATGMIEDFLLSNLRATTEVIRLSDPGAIIKLRQRFGREYLDTIVKATSAVLGTPHCTIDELRPPIAQGEESRQAWQSRQDDNPTDHTAGHQRSARVRDVMSRNVRVVSPEDTVQKAAKIMRQENISVLAVGEAERLIGTLTDHDLAIHLVAEARDPVCTTVREVMTAEVHYLFEDEDLDHAAETMTDQQVRRLPVVCRNMRLIGTVSLGDLAVRGRTTQQASHGRVAHETCFHGQNIKAE